MEQDSIGGFELPTTLRSAMETSIWRESPASTIRNVMPFLDSEIEFLSLERMHTYNGNRLRFLKATAALDEEERESIALELEELHAFRVYYGSQHATRKNLT